MSADTNKAFILLCIQKINSYILIKSPFPGSYNEEIPRKVNKLEKEQRNALRMEIEDYDSQFLKRMSHSNAKFTAICIYTNNINHVHVIAMSLSFINANHCHQRSITNFQNSNSFICFALKLLTSKVKLCKYVGQKL